MYNPTNWQAGDTVTSAKLNKMEQGIANGGIKIVHIVETEEIDETTGNPIVRLDITPNDLEDMLNNGQLPILYEEEHDGYTMYASLSTYGENVNATEYACMFNNDMHSGWFSTSLDEYFVLNPVQK